MRRATVKKDDALVKVDTKVVSKVITKVPTFDINKISFELKCKNESQKNLVNLINKNEITICSGPAGTGKAQPIYSKILTPDGWVKMGDISIGDIISTPDGNRTKVIGVFPQGEKDIYTITFSDGSSTECCEEHLWNVKDSKSRNHRQHVKYKDGKRIRISKPKDFITLETKNLIENLIEREGSKHSRLNYNIPITKPVIFENSNNLLDPYLIGLLLGDGSLTTNVGYCSNDDELINYISNYVTKFDCFFNIKREIKELKEGVITSNYNVGENRNNLILNEIKRLGLLGKKSNDKFIPKCYLFDSIDNRISLLQGLMDSDGTVNKTGHITSYNTVSTQLKNDIIELIQSLGGTATHTVKKTYFTYKGIKKQGQDCYNIHIRLDDTITPFKLKRKVDRYKPKTKYKPVRYISSIKFKHRFDAQCIMVEDEAQLYITDDYIVTHNTFIACAQALKLLKKDDKFNRIILVKSVTELEGESIGFLKGNLDEKLYPYTLSFLDNFHKIIGEDNTKRMLDMKMIEVLPLAYIRGRSIDNAIIIVDEAQNISLKNMRSTMTRIGEYSKMIITGDSKQIDMKNRRLSSLDTVVKMFNEKTGVGTMTFQVSDIVRSKVVMMIENEFDAWEESNADKMK